MKTDEFFYLSAIERKAGKQVYKRFGINRFELHMLVGLATYLRLFNKRIVSRDILSNWLGLSYRDEKKSFYYLYGLTVKGCLHRLAYRRPDGHSLAISPFGIRVLQYFDQMLKDIQRGDKIQGPTYSELSVNLNALPQGYIVKHTGRD